jgi:hypothetical protein
MWKAYRHWKGEVEVFDPITMTALTVAGGALAAGGTIMGGQAAKSSAYFTAAQEDQAAQESRAASQRDALEKGRQTGLVLSKLQARAAASGGGAADPGVQTIAGNIAGRGEYESLMDMYKGENRARGLEDAAIGERATGDAKLNASYLSAAGTLIGSAGSAYRTYNRIPGADTRSLDQIAYG